MSDHERGAYTPPTADAPLSFDARQPVRGARPLPLTLIVSLLVLAGLVIAIFVFYRSGVREAGQPPQTVGAPIEGMKSAPPAGGQPLDPAAGLEIYRSGVDGETTAVPQFTAPPEEPQPRAAPTTPVVVEQAPPAAAPTRPVTSSAALPPAAPAAKAPAAPPPPKAAPVAKAPAPKAAAGGSASVQIGAFSSRALADRGWNDAAAVAPGLAIGKGKNVEELERDGSTLFRTAVTGFASRADAAAFCDQLKAAGKSCFVR